MINYKLMLTLVCFLQLVNTESYSQISEGSLIYERISQSVSKTIFNEQPTSKQTRSDVEIFQLIFSGNKSIWQPIPDISKTVGSDGNNIVPVSVDVADIKTSTGDNLIYNDLESGITLTQREFRGKNYIIQDSIMFLDWKFTGETKKVLDFDVRQAIAERVIKHFVTVMENGKLIKLEQTDTTHLTAWFSDSFSYKGGPEVAGLSGTILELHYGNGSVSYRAVEFRNKTNRKRVAPPKGSKAIKMEDFKKVIVESMNIHSN